MAQTSLFFSPKNKDQSILASYGFDGKFIVMYLGAHGISHALNRNVEAAKLLEAHHEIKFVFVGEGAEKDGLVALARQLQLMNIAFIEGQPKQMVPAWYSIMDIGLVPLRDIPLFDTFIPSKMFEIMAMQRPIVASVKGEAKGILSASGAAIVCPPEDSRAIADAILELFNDANKRAAMGRNGREFVEKEFDRGVLARKYLSMMQNAARLHAANGMRR